MHCPEWHQNSHRYIKKYLLLLQLLLPQLLNRAPELLQNWPSVYIQRYWDFTDNYMEYIQ